MSGPPGPPPGRGPRYGPGPPPPGRGPRPGGMGPRPPAPGGGGIGRPLRDRGGPGGGGIGRPLADKGGEDRGGGTGPRAAGRGTSLGIDPPPTVSPSGRWGRGRSVGREEITRPGIGAGAGGASVAGVGSERAAAVSGSGLVGVARAGASAATSSGFVAAVFLAADFLAGLGSSGCCSRISPSRSARRRTRSACASMIDEECVLTPIPRSKHRSRHSLLVSPSSLASSWTRSFAARGNPFLVFAHRGRRRALYPRAWSSTGTNACAALHASRT